MRCVGRARYVFASLLTRSAWLTGQALNYELQLRPLATREQPSAISGNTLRVVDNAYYITRKVSCSEKLEVPLGRRNEAERPTTYRRTHEGGQN